MLWLLIFVQLILWIVGGSKAEIHLSKSTGERKNPVFCWSDEYTYYNHCTLSILGIPPVATLTNIANW